MILKINGVLLLHSITITPSPHSITTLYNHHAITISPLLSLHHYYSITITPSISLHHYYPITITPSPTLHHQHSITIIPSLSLHYYNCFTISHHHHSIANSNYNPSSQNIVNSVLNKLQDSYNLLITQVAPNTSHKFQYVSYQTYHSITPGCIHRLQKETNF